MLLRIASLIYKKIINIRNNRFDNDKISVYKCHVPVISVGNITVGGTGKTPFVQMLAKEIIELGRKPAIIGRGYKRNSKGKVVVSDGKTILSDARNGGDEMLLIAESVPAPVITHDKKYLAAACAENDFEIDSIIVDDGFQHRRLFRNLDIVLLDRYSLDSEMLLPAGRFREPLENIDRADVICFCGNFEINNETMQDIMRKNGKIFLRASVLPGIPYNIFNKKEMQSFDLQKKFRDFILLSSIAKPEKFEDMLENNHFNIIKHIAYPDHHSYSAKNIEYILEEAKNLNCPIIITTEKDATKLKEFESLFKETNIQCFVYPIKLKIIEGRDVFIKKLKEVLVKN